MSSTTRSETFPDGNIVSWGPIPAELADEFAITIDVARDAKNPFYNTPAPRLAIIKNYVEFTTPVVPYMFKNPAESKERTRFTWKIRFPSSGTWSVRVLAGTNNYEPSAKLDVAETFRTAMNGLVGGGA